MRPLRIAVVTNIPTPYRDGVYETLARTPGTDLCVFYCREAEPNRHWKPAERRYNSVTLSTFAVLYADQYVHLGTGIWRELSHFDPDVVFTSGYGPVMLQAFLWCLYKSTPHIPFTDGTPLTEAGLTWLHRQVRRIVFSRSVAFVGASHKSLELFRKYGIKDERLFESCLCVDNSQYLPRHGDQKLYDVMFCGQLIPRKMPYFFVEVVNELARRMSKCRVLVVGTGSAEESVRTALKALPNVELTMPGFVQPQDLPNYYRSSKVFVFPSAQDAWGVVANEAAAAGLPQITTPETGVAHELVQNGINGFVLPPNQLAWADAISDVLNDNEKYARMVEASLHVVGSYTFERAANGLLQATLYALRPRGAVVNL